MHIRRKRRDGGYIEGIQPRSRRSFHYVSHWPQEGSNAFLTYCALLCLWDNMAIVENFVATFPTNDAAPSSKEFISFVDVSLERGGCRYSDNARSSQRYPSGGWFGRGTGNWDNETVACDFVIGMDIGHVIRLHR